MTESYKRRRAKKFVSPDKLIKEMAQEVGFEDVPKCLCPLVHIDLARIDYCATKCGLLCANFLEMDYLEEKTLEEINRAKRFISLIHVIEGFNKERFDRFYEVRK